MTFEEWWEEPRVGLSREEELDRALNIDYFRVNRIIAEAYEAGRRQGHKEGYIYRETVYASEQGGI